MQECDWLILCKTFTVKAENWGRIAHLDGLAELFDFGWTFDEGIGFDCYHIDVNCKLLWKLRPYQVCGMR